MFYVDIGVYEMTMLVITEEQGDILCRSGWITTHSIVHTGYADRHFDAACCWGLPCNHCSNWTWAVEDILALIDESPRVKSFLEKISSLKGKI